MEVAARLAADAPRQDAVAGRASHSLSYLARASAMAWDAGSGALGVDAVKRTFGRSRSSLNDQRLFGQEAVATALQIIPAEVQYSQTT